MYLDKRVLLIAGGGTLGTYVASELLRLGAIVEVICPEEKVSHNSRLIFHQSLATTELLEDLFSRNHYHGIVNFIHYKSVEEYAPVHRLLIRNTDHLIFLSSYRVYADLQHPITESAPRLTEVISDPAFLETEDYAVPKSRCEDFLRSSCQGEPWTIVRPVISFSQKRLDLLMASGRQVLELAARKEILYLPKLAKDFTAGLDWAGNSGKLIANLLFREETIGDTFTIYSGHKTTWGEVADIYQKRIGLQVCWCDEAEYLERNPDIQESKWWTWVFDRRFNRDVDCSKVLNATGLTAQDFVSVEQGILKELNIIRTMETEI